MKRLLIAIAALGLVAATPAEVLPGLESQGFYIEDGSGATEAVVSAAVADASFEGSRLYIVVLAEEPASGAAFFSDAILDDLGTATVLTVAPESIGWVSSETVWTEEQFESAEAAALAGSNDNEVVSRFVASLVGAPAPGGGSGGSSGGGSGWMWFLVIGGGLLLFFFFLRSRSNSTTSSARTSRLREFYEAAQAKLDNIANDIIEMEDEVALADNGEVKKHYDSASATYARLIDLVPKATTADDLVDITYQLDIAIWELDVAEALLDGKEAPEKPEKVKLEEPAPQTASSPPQRADDFQRRTQRQSSPAGPDLGNILLAILAAQGMGGRGRQGSWGQPGSNFPGGGGFPGGPGGSMGGGRIRGGGRRRG